MVYFLEPRDPEGSVDRIFLLKNAFLRELIGESGSVNREGSA